MQHRLLYRKGNITILLVGLISVMLVMVVALSRRISGHTQLLTLSDYTQISRYFLESYAADVMQQIKFGANSQDGPIFKVFRDTAENQVVNASFYQPSPMLTKLAQELDTRIKLPPEITVTTKKELEYPNGFDCPNNLKGMEKEGLLEIVCKTIFKGREYVLRIQYPYSVVMRMTPVIKDFALFIDRIAEEQGNEKIGPDDNINIMYTKEGSHPSVIDSSVLSLAQHRRLRPGVPYRPLILLHPQDASEYADPRTSGKVYLGPSNRPVYLNLAGDTREQADVSMGELFLVSPAAFEVADDNTEFEHIGVFVNRSGEFVPMMGIDIKLKHNHSAKVGVLGFSHEIVPALGSIFAGTAYGPEDFFSSGSGASVFWRKLEGYGEGYMALSSGLKLMGMKPPQGSIPAREVYGNVLARFFLLTFWWPPSGGGEPLKYDETRSGTDFPSREVYGSVKYHFEPVDSTQRYQQFMSRLTSGSEWNPPATWNPDRDTPPEGAIPYNFDFKATTTQLAKKVYRNADFRANDGFLARQRLDALGQWWFAIHDGRATTAPTKGIEQRVGRVFSSGEEFLDAVGLNEGNFQVNGVVYINGPLRLPPLTMSNNRIGGGVVLVDGPIELANITRGYDFDTDSLNLIETEKLYQTWKTEITQDNFLTFVSLSGDPIRITGEALVGVHLINLKDQYRRPYDQIIWTEAVNKEILFCGGLALNYLNLPERLREFGRITSACNVLKAPFFMYHSAMAADKPSFAVQIMENMRGYRLTAGRISGND